MTENKDSKLSQVQQIGALTAIPVLLVLGPLGGYFVGNWIDKKFQIFPWCTLLFLVFGFVASGREIFSLLKQVSNQEKK